MNLELKNEAELPMPSSDLGALFTAFERVSGIPSPLKPGEDVMKYLIMYGDPFRVYKDWGRYGELLGFARAMDGEKRLRRPFYLRGAVGAIAARISSKVWKRIVRWEELEWGFNAYGNENVF